MLLLIDNYDSFTYNLAQYFGELGCELVVRRNDAISMEEIEALAPERICISPGPCTPREAGISKDVVLKFGAQTPILGVCLGTPMHRRSIWRRNRSRPAADAWKGVDHHA
jgi:anthranilate synthase/aminodeoxychorismate synthase-like glutamine amidotransferase